MRIFLTGFMGAGKTTVGRLLARRLDCPFVDLDERIAERAGASIPALFALHGEAGFRRLESAELDRVSAREDPLVVATGGGLPTVVANRRLMAERGTSVWLRPPFAVMVRRIAAQSGDRPLFRDPGQAEELYRSRLAAYRRADLELPVAAAEAPADTVERLSRLLAERACAT